MGDLPQKSDAYVGQSFGPLLPNASQSEDDDSDDGSEDGEKTSKSTLKRKLEAMESDLAKVNPPSS